MHLFDVARRFYGGNAIVGGGLPLAVGLALADRMQGRRRVTACFFGEGAVAEGEFHESHEPRRAVAAAGAVLLREQPATRWAPRSSRSESETDLALKARSYEMPAWSVDGMDVLAVEDAAPRAAARGPRRRRSRCFLELRTYRFRAHSMYDPELYRGKEEVERWKQRDPIPALERSAAGRARRARRRRARRAARTRSTPRSTTAVAFAEAGTLGAGRGPRRAS